MKVVITPGDQLGEAGRRLDASYHASDGVQALSFIRRWAKGQPSPQPGQLRETSAVYGSRRISTVAEVCEPGGIFIPGRFKRYYVSDPEHGERWLSPSDMLKADLSNLQLVSRKYTPSLENLRIHKDWILLSRSGTIGNMAFVREDMDGLIGSDDIIRVVADTNKILPGYLYTFLSSPLGKALIEQQVYGAVIQHIETHHVAPLPIPRLDPATEQRIHALIEQAASLRVAASDLRQKAVDLASETLRINLTAFPTEKILSVPTSDLDMRFEGTYHAANTLSKQLFKHSSSPLVKIGDLLSDIFYLGKLHRVFVDNAEQGAPLLSISDVQKAKLSSDKFVSRTLSRNVDQALLKEGSVLVSRTGTPGIVIFVRREMIGMAGTDHLVRLIPNTSVIFPGYLYSVLSSAVGQGLLVGASHGSVQLQLPPEYIIRIQIPVLSLEEQKPIHELIEHHGENLTRASELEDEAQAVLAAALGLPGGVSQPARRESVGVEVG